MSREPPAFYVLMIRDHNTLMTDFADGAEAFDKLTEWMALPDVRDVLLLQRYDGSRGPFYVVGAGSPYKRGHLQGEGDA